VGLYDVLLRLNASPVVELNRAVALGMRDGPQAGADAVNAIYEAGELSDYHLLHAARADFYRQLERYDAAQEAYETALAYAQQASEITFIERRIAEMKELQANGRH
jgi:RNA polymerase sigma-70 factor (ECF subfamily)